jgi:ribosomal protein S8
MTRLNIVVGVKKLQQKRFEAYLVSCNWNANKSIKTLLKPTKQLFITAKSIKKIEKNFSSESIFLTTSDGLISLKEASLKKIGGILLFRLI